MRSRVKVFGRFDPTTNPEELEEHAPNTFRLLNLVTESCRRQGQDEEHDPQIPHGRIVTVVSILGLGRARRTAKLFAKTLGCSLASLGEPLLS